MTAMLEHWRDGVREIIVASTCFLPQPRRKEINRWLRGREEHRKLQLTDHVLMSWGKSGRTWLRVMLSRYYQVAYGTPDGVMLEFGNLHKLDPAIPRLFFTHGNYLRNYTGNWTDKRVQDVKTLRRIWEGKEEAVSGVVPTGQTGPFSAEFLSRLRRAITRRSLSTPCSSTRRRTEARAVALRSSSSERKKRRSASTSSCSARAFSRSASRDRISSSAVSVFMVASSRPGSTTSPRLTCSFATLAFTLLDSRVKLE